MSADNYAICPKCCDIADELRNQQVDAAAAAYGKVDSAEYERLREIALQPKPALNHNFREDWEISGAEEGTLYIDYSGQCSVCGLKCHFSTSETFYPE